MARLVRPARQKKSFELTFGDGVANYVVHGRWPVGQLLLASNADFAVLDAVVGALSAVCVVRFARLCMADFEKWQNATSTQSYELAGRSLDGVRLVSSGAPPPLPQQEVDVSANPCRREFRSEGLVAGIAHTMWFGGDYEHVMRQRLSALRELDGEWEPCTAELWRVQLNRQPFTTETVGGHAERLETFRAAAFGDPGSRSLPHVPAPLGAVAHTLELEGVARPRLEEALSAVPNMYPRSPSAVRNPTTGEFIRFGDEHFEWRRDSPWGLRLDLTDKGVRIERPDSRSAELLARLRDQLGGRLVDETGRE
ncbi:MAG: hypothetical protein AB8H79_10340 [Myxococcota bacterium]